MLLIFTLCSNTSNVFLKKIPPFSLQEKGGIFFNILDSFCVIKIMNTTQQYPLVTVGAVIFNPNKEVFLIRTHKWHNKYGLPGGKIEIGETTAQALTREIKEETNLDIQNIEFVMTQEVIFSEEFYKKMHFIFFNYTCEITDFQEVILNDEAQEYLWISIEKALQLPLNQPTKALLEKIL